MKDLLFDIIKPLVNDEKEIFIKETEANGVITLQLSVAKEDMGRVIGRKGKIARAVRAVVKAAGTKEDKKVNMEIL